MQNLKASKLSVKAKERCKMKETTIPSEYKINPNNKMMIRIPCKVSSMPKDNDNLNTTHCSQMNVVLQFPETAQNSNYIIDEVRLILLDIFQQNLREQFTPCTTTSTNTKEATHESN